MLAHTIEIGDLFDVLGDVDMTDYCGQRGKYHNWEEKVATLALQAKGFEVLQWYSTDSDSFGPLVRAVKVVKNGVTKVLQYA